MKKIFLVWNPPFNLPLPVDYGIQHENTNERSDDVEDDVGPQTVNVDVPEVHSENQTSQSQSKFFSGSHLIGVPFMT